jgi:hypothetical protein
MPQSEPAENLKFSALVALPNCPLLKASRVAFHPV